MNSIILVIFSGFLIIRMRRCLVGSTTLVIPRCEVNKTSVEGATADFTVPSEFLSTPYAQRVLEQPLELRLSLNSSFNCAKDTSLKRLRVAKGRAIFTKFGHFGRFSSINNSTNAIFWYDPGKFCGLWESTGSVGKEANFGIGFCLPTNLLPNNQPVIIVKCCDPGYIVDLRTHRVLSCEPMRNHQTWTPTLYDQESFQDGVCVREAANRIPDYQLVTLQASFFTDGLHLFQHPHSWFELNMTESGIRWYLDSKGRIRSRHEFTNQAEEYVNWENSTIAGPKFCVDGLVNSHHDPKYRNQVSEIAMLEFQQNRSMLESVGGNNTVDQHVNDKIGPEAKTYRIKTVLFVTSYFLTSIFLGSTLIKSFFFKLHPRNIRGLVMITYSAALFFTNLSSGGSALMNFTQDLNERRGYWCTFLAICTHFCLLASGIWLMIIAWELYRALRFLNPDVKRSKGLTRYWVYCFIGFGLPGLGVGWLYYRDLSYGAFAWYFSLCPVLVPGYGREWCFLSFQIQGKFVHNPLLVSNAVGLVFYLLALRRLYKANIPDDLFIVYVVRNARNDPWLTVVLKLLTVASLTVSVDLMGLMWTPNIRTPEDASALLVALSIAMIVVRSVAIFFIVDTADTDPEFSVTSSSLPTTAPSSPAPDSNNHSSNVKDLDMISLATHSSIPLPPALEDIFETNSVFSGGNKIRETQV